MANTTVDVVKMQVKAKNGLNVRAAPVIAAQIVQVLSNDSTVNVYEQCNGWSRIGESQWLSSSYLISCGEAPIAIGSNVDKSISYPQLASDIGYANALYQQLKLDEGSRFECYRCSADKPTIGIGHNLQANGLSVGAEEIWQSNPQQKMAYDNNKENCWEGLVITAQQERQIFDDDIQKFENELQRNLNWYKNLADNPRCSLTNMCFNLGWNGLSKFKKMLAALEAGAYEKAANEALDSKWAIDVGARSYRVTEQMRTLS